VQTPSPAITATEAVRDALRAQRGPLLAMVRRRGGARVDAEELLQVAFERALSRSEQVRDVARVDAWVGRIVRHVVIDELRQRRDATFPVDQLDIAAVEDDCVDCWCVLAQAAQLKPEYTAILRRVIVDGAKVGDVAAELGLTPNNAMVRLHRARKALKERLAAHCGTTTARSCADCGCEERGCCPRP
jgi:DNA-directed RNA polymerase specialized sigma24 family protein